MPAPVVTGFSPRGFILRLAGSRGFQKFAARVPGLRRIARAEGAALFDLVAGFVQSQALLALVELRVLHRMRSGPQDAAGLGVACGIEPSRMQILLQAGAALGLLRRRRDGRFDLSVRGASLLAVPGLEAMITHHKAFYADLADPVALLRGTDQTALSRFWPYVFGSEGGAEVSSIYSSLMAESQGLVAEDVLSQVDFTGIRRLMDVGGGTGAFLAAVAAAHGDIRLDLFDLPVVVAGARTRLAAFGNRVVIHAGSFRDDPLPLGADAVSLVRVLYDHSDSTVTRLLAEVHRALPPKGRLIVAEPMSGGAVPDRATDVYFALYTLAMQTGRTRSGAEIAALLLGAGFVNIRFQKGYRPFVTSVITADRP